MICFPLHNHRKKAQSLAYKFVNKLGSSPTLLNEKNIKKIHEYIPVPNEYHILWADILSFGNYPSGIIITQEAIVLKSSKKFKKRGMEGYYRIIPWEYFNPDEFSTIESGKIDGNTVFTLQSDNTEVIQFRSPKLCQTLLEFKNEYLEAVQTAQKNAEKTVNSTIASINERAALYCSLYGAYNTKTGHGIWAEDVSAKLDQLHGETAVVVGRNNAKNGPDKLVNEVPVQCKYCASAQSSVDYAFDKSGKYRYRDLNGSPMALEVPKDQWIDAVEIMKERIAEGRVEGVTNPDEAATIVRQGKLTYRQAKNLAKAGTFESITYDVFTGAVKCASVFGISFLFTFGQVYWKTKDIKKAAKCAFVTGLEVYGLSIFASVISSQVARTGLARLFNPIVKGALNILPAETVKTMANQLVKSIGLSSITGAAAKEYYINFLSSQLATECLFFLVFSSKDIYGILSHNISSGQFWMNMTERLTTTVGTIAVASTVGKAIGGTFGGIAGVAAGTVAGVTIGFVTNKITHLFKEDDAVILARMLNAALVNISEDYLLSTDEQADLLELLNSDLENLVELQKNLFQSSNQMGSIYRYLRPKVKKILKKRSSIKTTIEPNIRKQISNAIVEGDFAYEM